MDRKRLENCKKMTANWQENENQCLSSNPNDYKVNHLLLLIFPKIRNLYHFLDTCVAFKTKSKAIINDLFRKNPILSVSSLKTL